MKLVGKPDAGNRPVRFDERGQETECCHMAQATAPVLDSTRREFITLLGGAAAWPLAARAQQDGRVRRVGVLMPFAEANQEAQARFAAFRQGLADLGWVEGRNLRLDVRWAGPDVASQQSQARELVALTPEVILAGSTIATQTLRDATRTIPIVFVNLNDPVATGVVSNLARPEANFTGFMSYEYSLAGKWLSLLKDMAPRLTRVALLFNPETVPFAPSYLRIAQDAGDRLALKVTASGVRDAAAIEPAIAAMAGAYDGGFVTLPDAFNLANRATTIALAAKYRVPAIYHNRSYPPSGGLMSYGPDQRLSYRDGATYVDRILRGAKPGDLPVQFATKFELVIGFNALFILVITQRLATTQCQTSIQV
jgi:putative ABC transport system substrate-binding protein